MKKHLNIFFRRVVSLIFVTVVIVLLAGCGKTHNAPLNVSEIFFGQKLSSISDDSYDADRFFVGTEDGNIYVVNTATNNVDTLLTSFDRIYKVVPYMTAQGVRYWVGTRNMGLLLCSRSADSLVAVNRYMLPSADRPERYSVYDISPCRTGVYVATSHGLLKVETNSKDKAYTGTQKLKAVFVNSVGEGHSTILQPMVACDLRPYGEYILLCASDKGLLKVDMRTDNTQTFINRKVSGIGLHGKDVMAVVEDGTLQKVDINGRQLAKVPLAKHAKGYFYDETNAMNYLVSDGHVQLFRDAEINQPDVWQQMEVGMSMPMYCHNVILANPRQHQSLLVGKYSLLRVANHQDAFNNIGEVKLACTSGKYIYYLVGTSLFRQYSGKNEAVQIKDISGGTGDVKFMQVIGNRLYYVDSANKAYSAQLYSSYFLNSLFSFDRPVTPTVQHEVTAMGEDGINVYLGIRDGLVNLHRADSCLDSNVFVNRFVRGADKVAFATLNDGVFTGRDNRFQRVAGSEHFSFVRDVAFVPSKSNDTTLYILTNHALLRSDGTDSIAVVRMATGYRRLLAVDNNNLYGVADFGIDNLSDSTRIFSDVHFEPEACLVADGKIYAASGSGVYVFGMMDGKDNTTESGYIVVKFVTKSLYSRNNIILLVILACVSVGFVWWYDRRRRRMTSVSNLQERLRVRVVELDNVKDLLGDSLSNDIDTWMHEIKTIDKLAPAEAKKRANDLNKKIQKATFKVPTILSSQLESQMEVINAKKDVKGRKERIEDSEAARLEGDVTKMSIAIKENQKWISSADRYKTIWKNLSAMFDGMIGLSVLTKERIEEFNVFNDPQDKLKHLYGIVNDNEIKDFSEENLVKHIKKYLSEQKYVERTKNYVAEAMADLTVYGGDKVNENKSFKGVYEGLVEACQDVLDNLDSDNPDVFDALSKMAILCKRRDMFLAVLKIHLDIENYFLISKKLEDTGVGTAQRRELVNDLWKYSSDFFEKGSIVDSARRFYEVADKSQDAQLLEMIGLTRKKGDGLFLSEKLLLIMMAQSKHKISAFSNMACASDQHIRKLRREIIGVGMASCLERIKKYAKDNPTSFAPLMIGAYEFYYIDDTQKYKTKNKRESTDN